MDQLKLEHSLGIKLPAVISFYGAGGKTTLISRLAEEICSSGRKVLITTTTKIFVPQGIPFFSIDDTEKSIRILKRHFKKSNIAVLGRRVNRDNKIEGIATQEVQKLRDLLQITVLVEADGAKGLPIKGFNSNEPILPFHSDLIVAVIGSDALGAKLSSNNVHRPAKVVKETGAEYGSIITEHIVAEVFQHMLKLGRIQAPNSGTVCLLNKADLLKDAGLTALKLSALLSGQQNPPDQLLITAGNDINPGRFTFWLKNGELCAHISCIVLAAGVSKRMGFDKLALPFKNNTILENTLEQIKKSGIKDIIIVVRPGSPWLEKLKKGPYKLIENPLYSTGMASSLKAGLNAVDYKTQGVLIALADQPFVTPAIYKKLINNYRNKLKLFTCPTYQGKRGNPTLSDRRIWPDLVSISGDCGGRVLIDKMDEDEIDRVETERPEVLFDIDTPDDYMRFFPEGDGE
ncbi:MAG: selenium cofactor biosynthesis protein YqeC [Bacillota bacterium]